MLLFGTRSRICLLIAALPLTLTATPVAGQPAAPPPPAKYKVQLRYQMPSPSDQHVAHYDALIAFLKRVDFEFAPPFDDLPETDREDPNKNVLSGFIGSGNVRDLLSYADVAAVLLMPPDHKLPDDATAPVKVRLELVSGLGLERQRALADQTRLLLGELGFREAVGYDERGYTGRAFSRLVGAIPASELETLLKDVRGQPSGWFAARFAPADLPLPLRGLSPIVAIEVVPEAEPAREPPEIAAREQPDLQKIDARLWELVNQKEQEARLARVEVILAYNPGDDESWRPVITKAAPSLLVEGRLGPIVSATVKVGQVPALSAVPLVSLIRLPRPARSELETARPIEMDDAAALRETGLERLHGLGYRGKLRGRPVRLAVIDGDFRGYEALVSTGKLPANTRIVDLTAERNPNLRPDPLPGDLKGPGRGTQCALAAVLAAPEVELTLIRVDPGAPYQVRSAADNIAGNRVRSDNLQRRGDELVRDRVALRKRHAELMRERHFILQDFTDETDLQRDYGILGPVRAWVFSDREWHALSLAEWERNARELQERDQRYLRLLDEGRGLKGIAIVASPLVWEAGYPLGGASALSRSLDDAPISDLLWFQAVGNTRGQDWVGPFYDVDGNGVMEFAPPQTPLPAERWTSELGFLGWQPSEGVRTPDLPEKTGVRISLQWREPHDPSLFFQAGEPDLYRQPLTGLRLVVLRQRDPQGKALSADDFEVVARSSGWPERLDNQPSSSIYEQLVEFTAVKGARYALRIERALPTRWVIVVDPQTARPAIRQLTNQVPTGLRPLGVATLTALERNWELRPRIHVETVEGPALGQGRPVFVDFATDAGSIGVPTDAHSVFAVGAAELSGAAQPSSSRGSPANLDLLARPDLQAFGNLGVAPAGGPRAFSTSLAAGFAAGTAAVMMSAGATQEHVCKTIRSQPGALFRLPPPTAAALPRR
jgi:hypothetical protein